MASTTPAARSSWAALKLGQAGEFGAADDAAGGAFDDDVEAGHC